MKESMNSKLGTTSSKFTSIPSQHQLGPLMDRPAGSPELHRPPGRGTKLIPARGSAMLTFPTNRRSLAPGMELDAPLNSGESYSLGNRCQFVAITMRNILSLADASQQGNRALCGGKRSKGFSPEAHSAHLIHLLLSLSLSLPPLWPVDILFMAPALVQPQNHFGKKVN